MTVPNPIRDISVGVSSTDIDISFFVACYNEEENIVGTVEMLLSSVAEVPVKWEILVIDDASQDNSVEVIEQFITAHPNLPIYLKVNNVNRGLGANYVDGAFLVTGKYYRLICGDNVELKENLVKILKLLGQADMIVPSIEITGRSLFRRLLSTSFTRIVNLLSGYRIKYYNGLAVHLRYNVMRWHGNYHGFGFQADLITRLLDEGATYVEVPVFARERAAGKSNAMTLINFLSVTHFFLDLCIRQIGRRFFPHYKLRTKVRAEKSLNP
jgi:glycosyltransferase involved in cell wall biosynthesis